MLPAFSSKDSLHEGLPPLEQWSIRRQNSHGLEHFASVFIGLGRGRPFYIHQFDLGLKKSY